MFVDESFLLCFYFWVEIQSCVHWISGFFIAKKTCYKRCKLEYHGNLMAGYYDHPAGTMLVQPFFIFETFRLRVENVNKTNRCPKRKRHIFKSKWFITLRKAFYYFEEFIFITYSSFNLFSKNNDSETLMLVPAYMLHPSVLGLLDTTYFLWSVYSNISHDLI